MLEPVSPPDPAPVRLQCLRLRLCLRSPRYASAFNTVVMRAHTFLRNLCTRPRMHASACANANS
eukprot:2004466-Pleurochrysis_carterae.AAC.2